MIVSNSYNRKFAHFICLSSPKANDWTAIRDGNNNRLSIGGFSFKKKGISSYTEANNARDVIAMLYLMSFLQLEDYHVTTAHSTVTDTAMLRIKNSSEPTANEQPININLFGSVNKKETIETSVQSLYVTQNENYTRMLLNTGIQYSKKISSKLNLLTSFTFSPETKFKNTNDRVIATVTYSNSGSEASFDVSDVVTTKINMINPSKFSFGAGIGKSKTWLIGTEITFTENQKLVNRFPLTSNAFYENSTRFALGGYYIPKYDSFSSYFNRVTYRAGFRYENSGLVLRNESINDYGMTFGLGLPVGLSKINLGFEYGKKGTTAQNLIQENYFNINVGFSLNDLWFRKREIN